MHILHDPTLVEDMSELRNLAKLDVGSMAGEQSVSGSVVVTTGAQDSPSDSNNSVNNSKSKNTNFAAKNKYLETIEQENKSTNDMTTLQNHRSMSNDQMVDHTSNIDSNEKATAINSNTVDNMKTIPSLRVVSMTSSHYSDEGNTMDPDSFNDDNLHHTYSSDANSDNKIEMDNNNNMHEMEYSDSDFEDNLQQRMLRLDVDVDGNVNSDATSLQSPDYETIFNKNDHISEDESDDEVEEEEDDDVEEDDEDDYQSIPPPKELDPDKLYALYPFNGPDQSHCKLDQDEACVLLNDEDSYWWLVKRCRDNNIGFAPAEVLETFPERLARLNCWKNENMTSISSQSLPEEPLSTTSSSNIEENATKQNVTIKPALSANEKSVSFNDVISYADRYIQDDSDEYTDIDEDKDNELNGTNIKHFDKFTEEPFPINGKESDDISEVVSDVSFNTGYSQSLSVAKIRESKSIKNIHDEIKAKKKLQTVVTPVSTLEEVVTKSMDKEIEQEMKNQYPINQEGDENSNDNGSQQTSSNDLQKIFEAPIIPFGKKQHESSMKNSTSDYSISTIGEFSPSSSEWTNDSPKLTNGETSFDNNSNDNNSNNDLGPNAASTRENNSKLIEDTTIPSSNALQNISDIVENAIEEDKLDQTNIGTYKHENISLGESITQSLNSDDDFKMYSEVQHLQTSTTSVNTNNSTLNKINEPVMVQNHILVQEMYQPILQKIDTLMDKIDSLLVD